MVINETASAPSQTPKGRNVRDYSTGGLLDPLLRPRPLNQAQNGFYARNGDHAPNESQIHLGSQLNKTTYVVSNQDESRPRTGTAVRQEAQEREGTDFVLEMLDAREPKASYEPSVTTQHTMMTSSSSSRVADFFSSDVFQVVLHNPTTAHQLHKFAQSRLCGENIDFLEKVDLYQQSLNNVTKAVFDIHKSFISSQSATQINLPANVLDQLNKNLKFVLAKTIPSMESVFSSAQEDIEKLVASDVYPAFVRYQMNMSVMKALASNKNKYAGLGDCFVLTNPSMADNPIVYASDGFVKVTGYQRNEIIPRNCRFLQNKLTDRKSVKRLKHSILEAQESVELLLNERKTGEPFWNLLYTTPLKDQTGKVSFFLGGQINVSTTVHNASDILRVLSCNAEDEEPDSQLTPVPPVIKPKRYGLLGSLGRSKSRAHVQQVPGMESKLLQDLDNIPSKEHKDAFYSAYSKYLIIDAYSMHISFFSEGMLKLLYPARQALPVPVIGSDVFKFLAQHASSGLPRDYKNRVRASVKAGRAISLDTTLSTRRQMGYEKFATHWTPLKNDRGETGFIVLTLGSTQDTRHL